MAGIAYTKLIEALKGIGVDVSQQQASNVKKLFPKNKSTATKVGLLAAERDRGGTFGTVLDIFKNEAKYIDSMNDAEQMAFLNNILDYNEFGGKSIGVSRGIEATDAMKDFKNTQSELKKALEDLNTDKTDLGKSIEDLNAMAKSLKDETTKNKDKALKDLDDFMETGGQPFKKKDDKFLGGSMHEEGQIRTGIREFLQSEYKNGRLKLNDLDKARVMEYSPMIEHDPILVFKKIYGEEAYNKAGSFPGAFEIGEDFKHYEKIFRENMGKDLLTVKNKEYIGDGKLILTEREAVHVPKDYDPDIPYATGGRAGYYVGGQAVIEPDLSDIGHGSDSLMARTRMTAPGSQSTTSTGLNYLLGEDNDNTRVPFNDGLLVPQSKPYTKDMFDKDSMTLLKGMHGTGPQSNSFLYNEMIKKGNMLRNQGIERETVIEIIRKNKDKINAFLETQTTSPKSFEGMAKGGRIGFAGGGADMGTVSGDTRKATAKSVNVSPSGQVTTSTTRGPEGPDDRSNFQQNVNHREAMRNYQKPPESVVKNIWNTGQEFNYLRNLKNLDPYGLAIGYGVKKFGPSIMEKIKNLRSKADIEKDGITQMVNNDFTRFNFEDLTGMKPVNNSDYTQLAKVFNTKKDLQSIGAAEDSWFDTLTPEGEALEKFRKNATSMNNPTGTFKEYKGLGAESQLNTLLGNKNKNAIENEAFIRDALNQGFLADESDFLNQKPLNKAFAEGGIAGLRPGYAGGTFVDKGRRGFLKWLGGTAAGVVALKTGLAKILGKESGAVSKKVIDEVIIDGSSGAPSWLQPLVNKALREGTDKTKNLAYKDAQEVKRLDTPTGQVDVYYDVRSGEVEIDYLGGNTALGESVNMRYTPGIGDEMTKGKPMDEFEATEAIPEMQVYNKGNDYSLEVGENTVENVKGLYSDTSELAELGGEKLLIKDISESIKKKRKLKQMENDPTEFATEGYSTGPFYDPS